MDIPHGFAAYRSGTGEIVYVLHMTIQPGSVGPGAGNTGVAKPGNRCIAGTVKIVPPGIGPVKIKTVPIRNFDRRLLDLADFDKFNIITAGRMPIPQLGIAGISAITGFGQFKFTICQVSPRSSRANIFVGKGAKRNAMRKFFRLCTAEQCFIIIFITFLRIFSTLFRILNVEFGHIVRFFSVFRRLNPL